VMLVGVNESNQLSNAEASQAFTGSTIEAMLVPIPVGRQVLAVASCAGLPGMPRRRWRRSDILFARIVAYALGLAIRNGLQRSVAGGSDKAGKSPSAVVPSRLRGQVNSSLSGILGSLEMIKSQQKPGDVQLDKYLSIIDKSAHRIKSYLTQPVSD